MPPRLPEVALPSDADVVIVGSGFTGVAAARELRARGRGATVLEQGRLGRGASTRNGGIVHPGLKPALATFLKKRGQLGRALYDETVKAFDFAEATISDLAIDCDYSRSGHLQLAARRSQAAALQTLSKLYESELGEVTRFIPADRLSTESGSVGYHGGLVLSRSGSVDPAKYYSGLLAGALASGAEFHEDTQVTGLVSGSTGFLVHTSRGTVRARDVLMATDGYTDGVMRALQRRIIPIGSYGVATEPLSEELAAYVSPTGRSQMDTRNFLYSWRVLPDRRLLFGGRSSFAPITLEAARDHLYHSMLRVLPRLAGVKLSHTWSGTVGFTFDRLPHAGRHAGVAYSIGYCGSGVALAPYLGQQMAAWLTGDKPPLIARLPFPTTPLYRGRPWFLPAIGRYYQLKDRLP